MTRHELEDLFQEKLNDKTIEDILEDYDLTPLEVLLTLFDLGYINESLTDE